MTVQTRDLSVLAYANGFTLWHYAADAAAAELGRNGYFDAAGNLLRRGDIIIANLEDGQAAIIAVTANADAGVATARLAATRAGARPRPAG